jgi:hypothetical protein
LSVTTLLTDACSFPITTAAALPIGPAGAATQAGAGTADLAAPVSEHPRRWLPLSPWARPGSLLRSSRPALRPCVAHRTVAAARASRNLTATHYGDRGNRRVARSTP